MGAGCFQERECVIDPVDSWCVTGVVAEAPGAKNRYAVAALDATPAEYRGDEQLERVVPILRALCHGTNLFEQCGRPDRAPIPALVEGSKRATVTPRAVSGREIGLPLSGQSLSCSRSRASPVVIDLMSACSLHRAGWFVLPPGAACAGSIDIRGTDS